MNILNLVDRFSVGKRSDVTSGKIFVLSGYSSSRVEFTCQRMDFRFDAQIENGTEFSIHVFETSTGRSRKYLFPDVNEIGEFKTEMILRLSSQTRSYQELLEILDLYDGGRSA